MPDFYLVRSLPNFLITDYIGPVNSQYPPQAFIYENLELIHVFFVNQPGLCFSFVFCILVCVSSFASILPNNTAEVAEFESSGYCLISQMQVISILCVDTHFFSFFVLILSPALLA